MSKIYFSRSMTRTMSADHPVGDPTGGAAYGEKNDPISAVLSIATMAGTYATAGTFAAMTIAQGITFAGAALSLVGNVTGNKTLSKIGMVAGIAGGISQLAGIQGPTLGQTFGGSAPVSSSGGTAASAMSSKSGSLSQSQASGNLAAGDLADEMAAAQKTASANMAARGGNVRGAAGMAERSNAAFNQPGRVPPADIADDIAGGGFQKITNPAGAGQTGSDWQYFKDAGGNTAAIDPSGKYFLNGEQVTGAAGGKFGVGDYANMAWQGTKNVGAGILNFAKDNPYGALAVGQVAQPIADYLSGKTDAEIDALEAQTGYADANALRLQEEIAKEKRRRENLNAGYAQVNTGINVNPAVIGQAQAGGLISGAMQPAA